MLFMVIERFDNNDMRPVYRRVREKGRMLPDRLKYVDRWVELNFGRCFQIMECDDPALLQEWTLEWDGCGVTFEEIIAIIPSAQTRAIAERNMQQTTVAGWPDFR